MGKHHGFTLVEMTVVIVIIGLLMAAAMGVGNTQMQASRISSTKQKQEAIKLALINFITRNNRLPCPAIPTLAPGAVGYGVEAANPGTCTGTGAGPVVSGIVPFSTLGITDENASDGYYNRFTYMVVASETNLNLNTIAGMRGAISIHNASPVAAANLSVTCPAGGYDPCASVAVVISHGINGLGAYNSQGQQLPMAALDERENVVADNAVIIKEYSADAANPFDDIVMPMTPSDLLTPLAMQGTLKDYRAQLNESFNQVTSAVVADAVENRIPVGGVWHYPLPAASPVVSRDPWNNPIRYELSYSPITPMASNDVAFTLTSDGADLTQATADDISLAIITSQLQGELNKWSN